MQTDTPNTTATYQTTRFSEIVIAESDVLVFPDGLLGFNHLHRYTILKDDEQEPFYWLQSLEDADLSFVIVDPFIFFPGYEIQIKSHELAAVQLKNVSDATVLTIITVPDEPMDLTANLRGPLIINTEDRMARQFVLIDDRYHTKHYLLKDIPDYLTTSAGSGDSDSEEKETDRD